MKRKKAQPVIEADDKTIQSEQPKSIGGVAVTFVGDPRGGADPANPSYGGKLFPKGEPVRIEDENWLKINANILKNSHFKVT